MNQNYNGQIPPHVQERLNELQVKTQIELDKEASKSKIQNEARLDFEQRRMCLQESRRQIRAASYTVVRIEENGTLQATVKNAMLDLPSRPIANFEIDMIVNLKSSEGDGGIYGLQLVIQNVQKQIFLNAQKVGKLEYLMRKIMAVGGQIFADTEKNRKNIIASLWPELLKRCAETVIVPANRGWIRDGKKHYRYVEKEAILWDEILRRAK